MFSLKLENPLVFFDLETTGTDTKTDRIVEISVIKIMPDGEREVKTRRVNPEMPIPPQSTEIHGITDQDVKDKPTFKKIAQSFYLYLENCNLAGYNIMKFDIDVLINEFKRAGIDFSIENRKIIDAFRIFSTKEPRDLSSALKFYCNKEMENAHSAEADTLATVDILEGQFKKYSDLPKDINELHKFCKGDNIDLAGRFRWQNGEAVIKFGKNAGKPLKSIASENPGFLKWIISRDFEKDVKKIASDALEGRFPEKNS